MDNMLKKNDMIDIRITDLTVEGAGIGRHNGFTVFVPGALPDESVRAKIIKATKSYAVGRLMHIQEVSPERVTPFCPVFEACGGCTLQHLDYAGQLQYKRKRIKDCFNRIGGMDIELPEVLAADNVRDYRNKAAFPVAGIGGKAAAGFYAPRSHRLIACDCPVQKQQVNDVKNAVVEWANKHGIPAYNEADGTGTLRHIIGRAASDGGVMAGVVLWGKVPEQPLISALKEICGLSGIVINRNAKRTNAILGAQNRVIFGDPYITEKYDGLVFRAGLTSFLQVNHAQSQRLYQTALSFADISAGDIVFDLFCGIGTISLLAAKQAKIVLGIEYGADAVQNAAENARLNGIDNAAFLAGDAAKMLEAGYKRAGRPDIVILDPPRKGCDATLLDGLAALSPQKIVYVSCNPATLARDISRLGSKGYAPGAVMGVDMFPHTTHVETVITLHRV